MPPSIYDIMCAQKIWTFNGALIPAVQPAAFQKAYPSVGLTCEVFTRNDGTDGIISVPPQSFHSWTGPAPGTVNDHTTYPRVQKALRLRMIEPASYQTHLHTNYPAKFPQQGPMCTSLKLGIQNDVLFVEHGEVMISNPLNVKDSDIKGGVELSVFYVIKLVGGPAKWAITITGHWSDGYLGTGGWC